MLSGIQIKFKLTVSLSEYKSKVENRAWDFPDFSDKCPICHAKDCAVRIGFYHRNAENVVFDVFIEDLPVARYLCRRKGRPKIEDRTFSLLPSVLIPYRKWTILSLMAFVKDYLAPKLERIIPVENCIMYNYLKVFKNTVSKLNIFLRKNLKQDVHLTSTTREELVFAYNFIEKFIDPETNERGAEAIDWYYYTKSEGFLSNSQFLFGTPYQHR